MNNVRFDTKVQYIKYRVLCEVAKSAFKGNLLENLYDIPKKISPGPKATIRCCVYKERAILQERIQLAISGIKKDQNVVSVISIACDECPAEGYRVTDDCRGCLSHRCRLACRKDAISFGEDLKARIDKSKCVNCGLCAKACPYSAIQSRKRPCVNACKTHAITTGENQAAMILDEKCIQCGACVYQCPFGAISDRSSIVQVIEELKNPNKNVYAILAPAIASQFDYAKFPQVVSAIKELGFYQVVETAVGADMVAYSEAQELAEKGMLTSSCCPAFVKYIRIRYPQLADKISHNPSPMIALGRFLKSQDHQAVVVFIGPCTAKKREAIEDEQNSVDFVLTVEELQALISAKEINVASLEGTQLDNASYFGRIFARAGGLSEAVVQSLKEQNIDFQVKAEICDGIENIKPHLSKLKKGDAVDFNFLEGMACLGGCIGGPCNINHELKDKFDIDKFSKTATKTCILETLAEFEKTEIK